MDWKNIVLLIYNYHSVTFYAFEPRENAISRGGILGFNQTIKVVLIKHILRTDESDPA